MPSEDRGDLFFWALIGALCVVWLVGALVWLKVN
jgi:hypothetical protein